jgi:hypothetical protein
METLIFLFEGSQAMPASPSDRGEILFKVVEVQVAAAPRYKTSPRTAQKTPLPKVPFLHAYFA